MKLWVVYFLDLSLGEVYVAAFTNERDAKEVHERCSLAEVTFAIHSNKFRSIDDAKSFAEEMGMVDNDYVVTGYIEEMECTVH